MNPKRTMKAIWRGTVVAESDRTLEVGGYRYFPREKFPLKRLFVTRLLRPGVVQRVQDVREDLDLPSFSESEDLRDAKVEETSVARRRLVPRGSDQDPDGFPGEAARWRAAQGCPVRYWKFAPTRMPTRGISTAPCTRNM